MKKVIIAYFALSTVLFLSFPSSSYAAITVSIVQPSGGYTESSLTVIATVTSTFTINSVVAQVEGRTAILSPGSLGWTGTMDLDGLNEGIKTITVTATDGYGSTGIATANFTYDKKPTISIIEPLDNSVATPMIRVSATCSDTKMDCSSLKVTAYAPYTVLATGTTSLDQIVSLAAYNGRQIYIEIVGTDSAGQETITITRKVYVESSGRLTKIADFPGTVLDYGADGRVLYLDTSDFRNALKINDITIFDIVGRIPQQGYLTPSGAIFWEYNQRYTDANIYDFRNGSNVLLLNDSTYILKVAGNYAIFRNYLRNLSTGTNVIISGTDIDVAANGDVVYKSGGDVFRYRTGTSTRITNMSVDSSYSHCYHPMTDGINIVYIKYSSSSGGYNFFLFDGKSEINLTHYEGNSFNKLYSFNNLYKLNNGYTAYIKTDDAKMDQVWLRSPSGVNEQVTYFGNTGTVSINALAPTGELLLSYDSKLYSYQKGKSLTELSSTLLKPIYVNNQWYAIIGRSIFSLDTRPDTTPPTATVTIPATNAIGFPVSNAITVTFSEDIETSTINSSTFTVMSGTTPVTGTVSYDASARTATFTPSSYLSYGTSYTVKLTTGMKDLAGNYLAANYNWTFTTARNTNTGILLLLLLDD